MAVATHQQPGARPAAADVNRAADALLVASARNILAEQLALEGLGPPSSAALSRSIPTAAR